jgi:hypothetical protein
MVCTLVFYNITKSDSKIKDKKRDFDYIILYVSKIERIARIKQQL